MILESNIQVCENAAQTGNSKSVGVRGAKKTRFGCALPKGKHGADKAIVILRAEAARIERHASAGVAQLVAVAGGAVVAVNHRACLDRVVRVSRGRNRDEPD